MSKPNHAEAPDHGEYIRSGAYAPNSVEMENSSAHECILVLFCSVMVNSRRRAKCDCATLDLVVFLDHGRTGVHAMSLVDSGDK